MIAAADILDEIDRRVEELRGARNNVGAGARRTESAEEMDRGAKR